MSNYGLENEDYQRGWNDCIEIEVLPLKKDVEQLQTDVLQITKRLQFYEEV